MAAHNPREWHDLSRLADGEDMVVERVKLPSRGVTLEGAWLLPELARLAPEDQVFVAAFVRSHGSIKEMEQVFGVSYPTVKARLHRIAERLEFVDTSPRPSRASIVSRLQRGEITPDEAIKALEGLK